jgi:hypothetical protein
MSHVVSSLVSSHGLLHPGEPRLASLAMHVHAAWPALCRALLGLVYVGARVGLML